MFRLIVGVGNPGREYQNTRHNVAWMFLETNPLFQKAVWKVSFKGLFTEISLKGEKIFALKPQTYMNLSGESVSALVKFYKIPPSEILVIHDELDLPFGQVHFKMGGGFAGHNGLKSIAEHLSTDQFARLRIGIGRPSHGNVSGWVLGAFNHDESAQLPLLFEKLYPIFDTAMVQGLNKVGTFNKKNLIN